jgi:hypothetical protein
MYDADYDAWLQEKYTEAEAEDYRGEFLPPIGADGRYFTRASGQRAQHTDGVVRDTEDGKTKYTLMFPEGVPMEDQLIVRIAELYTRGGKKYGDRNWENSCAPDTLKHHTDALWRHFMNFFFDVQDGEDHAAAIVWNINAMDLTRRNIRLKAEEAIQQFDDTPPGPSEYMFQLPDPIHMFKQKDHRIEAATLAEAMQEFERTCVKGLCDHNLGGSYYGTE